MVRIFGLLLIGDLYTIRYDSWYLYFSGYQTSLSGTNCLIPCFWNDRIISLNSPFVVIIFCYSRRKIHVCKICNKTLTRFEHLKRHLITHLKEKPFSCQTCNRGFNRSEHLINHTGRCKGDRVHICNICNKGFNREDSLEVRGFEIQVFIVGKNNFYVWMR